GQPRAGGPYGEPDTGGPYEARGAEQGDPDSGARSRVSGRRGGAGRGKSTRHAYYPGRRMSLGVVLLPLRVFLGFISIYAGMGKLCDPVYFDGGDRGSMVTWLRSLEPWAVATPLHDFALGHPVGAGLTVAFLQVIIGVLTVCGLWQRLAAGTGAVVSAALLVTVSWHTVPAYDAPDIVYLAAWSPLIIAGAPVYSMDARLAGEAWRRLGPRVELWDLRRRVLRRGTALATVVVGSALLVGALLGGAVRSTQTVTVPDPGEPPRNELPGSPLPREPGARNGPTGPGPDGTRQNQRDPRPSASSSSGPAGAEERSSPGQRETVPAPQPSAPTTSAGPEAPARPSGGSTTAGDGTTGAAATGGPRRAASGAPDGSGGGGTGGGGSTSGSGGTSGGREGGNALGGLLG
ncbi:DoxX family protein, partial [Streptomyces oceani]|uniref:DoxX family protein n=1 Tax=Streptomyces oceani TaxID=1075402 RepID=UPI000D1AC4BE